MGYILGFRIFFIGLRVGLGFRLFFGCCRLRRCGSGLLYGYLGQVVLDRAYLVHRLQILILQANLLHSTLRMHLKRRLKSTHTYIRLRLVLAELLQMIPKLVDRRNDMPLRIVCTA